MQCFDGEEISSNTMKTFLVSCFLFVHSVAEVCQKLDQCSCKKNSGRIISLWEIDGGSNPAQVCNNLFMLSVPVSAH